LQAIKAPVKWLLRKVARRLAGNLRQEVEQELSEMREQLAGARKEALQTAAVLDVTWCARLVDHRRSIEGDLLAGVRQQLEKDVAEVRRSLDTTLATVWQDLRACTDRLERDLASAVAEAQQSRQLLADVRADLAQTTQGYVEFQLVMTQQVADEVTRIHKRLEDALRAGALPAESARAA
jgi:hypothetical protein